MVIKTEMLRYFVAVAQSGNLADAAERVGRTPSAVSMMLKHFEAHLGRPLFESERKSKLTALGTFVLAEARRELEHFDRTVASIESYARADTGLVRVAAIPSVATSILPEAISRFLAAHGDVKVHVRDMESGFVLRELEAERADLGYGSLLSPVAGLVGEVLFSDRFGAVCAADHPLRDCPLPLSWEDLGAFRFITNGVCSQIETPEFREILARSQLSVLSTTANLSVVRAGAGITIFPEFVLKDIDEGLCFLPLADAGLKRQVHRIIRAHASLSPAAQSFHAVVEEVVAEMNVGMPHEAGEGTDSF
ncbi:LysR family transcriptional regulator [Sulfitobacter aestuarii]|uniref:LysR family transcriptional regulator n=1 Tax=Sulfitobacter aestuarii TaxID=2161676 RepID=A0ABW5U324_9RHOB